MGSVTGLVRREGRFLPGLRRFSLIAVVSVLAVSSFGQAQANTPPAPAHKAAVSHIKKPLNAAQRKAAAATVRKKEAARVARIIKAAGPPPPVKKQYDGVASFYSDRQKLASGGRFNPAAMTAAHRSLPFGTKVQVTDKHSGKKVTVTINDRGPFKKGRVIDLSRAAAHALGMGKRGVSNVHVTVLPKKSAVYANAAPSKK